MNNDCTVIFHFNKKRKLVLICYLRFIRSAGKRNAAATAFCDAFGKLSILRSFCKQGEL